MKKLLPILILFCACQKEDVSDLKKNVTDTEKSEELHAVTFNLSGFTQHTEPISGGRMAGKTRLKATEAPCPDCPGSRYDYDECFWRAIKYYAYEEETGDLVRTQTSTYGSEDYGRFTDSLPAGNYDIIFVMCRGELTDYDWGLDWVQVGPAIHYSSKFDEAVLTGYAYGAGGADLTSIGGMPDLFFKRIKLEVSGDIVIDDVELPRVVGGIEVRLTDDSFPDDLLYLNLKYSTHERFKFNEGAITIDSGLAYNQYWEAELTDSGYYMSEYIMPDTETGKFTTDVEIAAYRGEIGGPHDMIAHKVIHDVEIETNKKTVLTGKLFDAPSQEFTVKVDTVWAGENELEF